MVLLLFCLVTRFLFLVATGSLSLFLLTEWSVAEWLFLFVFERNISGVRNIGGGKGDKIRENAMSERGREMMYPSRPHFFETDARSLYIEGGVGR